MSINSIPKTGSIGNAGSIKNIQGGGHIGGSSPIKQGSTPKFEGNLIGNSYNNLQEIGARITTLIGGVLGTDKEASDLLYQQAATLIDNPSQGIKDFANAALSTYNLAVDDFGSMPLGEMVGNVLTGAWKHPIDAFLDVTTLGQMAGVGKAVKALKKSKGKIIAERDILVKSAEQVTKENVRAGALAVDFENEIYKISKKYTPEQIGKSLQAIETIGFKNAPRELLNCMQDLTKANDTYKMYTASMGAEILDDVNFATRELISKQYGITFQDAGKIAKDTDLYKNVEQYVKDNQIKPMFHLSPDLIKDLTKMDSEDVIKSNLLERKFGTIDYETAGKDFYKKATDFIDKADAALISRSPQRINEKIKAYNKANGTDYKELNVDKSVISSKVLKEINNEMKKTMLGAGTYLGANIVTTTLSILNNFDLKAAIKTFKELPQYRKVKLSEAETPVVRTISKLNNAFYAPVAGVDKLLERISNKYIYNMGEDAWTLMQSTIPSRIAISNPVLNMIKNLIPFGQYPAAAAMEIGAWIKERPGKTFSLNQAQKQGEPLNIAVQEALGISPHTESALRKDENGNTVSRSTVVTPIQALNMFMFGQSGDAVQIPVITFINKLVSGQGDPHVIEVEGRKYRIDNEGNMTTDKGTFNIIPALSYAGRNMLGPVNFYNQVLVPILSDKYIKDDSRLTNKMINDTQYSNLSSNAKSKITDNAREKLAKKLVGTYEYNYYDPDKHTPRRVKMKVKKKYKARQELRRI